MAVFLVFAGLVALAPGLAHHAFSWEFDASKPVSVSGTVTKVDWANPHTYFYVDVRDDKGRVVNWIFETAGPNTLNRRGCSRDSLKRGEPITVLGYRARGAPNIGSARLIVLGDGRRLMVGSPDDGGPQP